MTYEWQQVQTDNEHESGMCQGWVRDESCDKTEMIVTENETKCRMYEGATLFLLAFIGFYLCF